VNDLISRQAVLDFCEKAADTCREMYMGVLDKVGHGESEASAFGACAYFMQKETMYRHEIPSTIAQVDGAVRWIPVAERPPEGGENVVMLFETGIVCGGFICENGTWFACSDGEHYTDCSDSPTYWMPPPKLPEMKEESMKHGGGSLAESNASFAPSARMSAGQTAC